MDNKARLRELGLQYAHIANQDQNTELTELYKTLNSVKVTRPLVRADEIPWHEMNVDGELTNLIDEPFLRDMETFLLRSIYQHKHMNADAVYDPFIVIPRAVTISGYGLTVDEETIATDKENGIVSHSYNNLIKTAEDVEKIVKPTITEDLDETNRRFSVAHDVFDGILDVKPGHYTLYMALWDEITSWMGAEELLMTLITDPDLMHMTIDRLVNAAIEHIKEMEERQLTYYGTKIHASYNYLPEAEEGPLPLKKVWLHATAQIFGSVSKEMHKEFEFDYIKRLFEYVGYGHYGCCEPLNGRVDLVRTLPNVRKISCSPWCDIEAASEEISGDFVASFKPSPSYLAGTSVDWDVVEKQLSKAMECCKKNNTPIEIILKDISTVNYQPERLWEWTRRAAKLANAL